MKKFIERMKTEAEELDGRIAKAKKAVENPPYGADSESINLLKEQIVFMESYSAVLEKRIARARR